MVTGEEPGRSLRDAVTQALRAQIVSGELPPGTRLVERRLAEQLEVSRVPVREALRVLEREGLLDDGGGRGMTVRRLADDDVAMLFAVRGALETVLAARLVEVADAADLDALEALVVEAETHVAAGRPSDAVRVNAAFHERLTGAARSEVLTSVLEPIASRMAWLLNQHTDPRAMAAEHREVLEAVRARNAEAATRVLAAHLTSSRAALAAATGPDA
ncbi:GntR family transcriptional regulator [Intrasporangium flavum]|uniref:GntR family transcriptional regulator n=1 Tax=Intrasporangium flavum TaxID=1428657 RepID=UPI00096CA3D0|nr:GntR family transcriptional regulator [Intrasporangium flavum]